MPELDLTTLLVVYGPMGAMLAWFGWRLERTLERLRRSNELMARAILRWLERVDAQEASQLSKELYRINGDG